MHDGVRIVCLLALAAALPALGLPALALLCAGLLLTLRGAYGAAALRRCLHGLWRLRWLMFAIAALYLWQAPGEAVWSALPGLTDEGLIQALRRMLVLAVLLAAVFVLTESTPAAHIAAGIVWLCSPLRWLGFPVQRLALRIALVFDAVRQARELGLRLRGGGGLVPAASAALLAAERGELAASEVAALPRAGLPGPRSLLVLGLAVLLVAVNLAPIRAWAGLW